jgi:glycosyltransferase involved in cell wall biosynthesis
MRILKITQTYYPYISKGGPPAKVRAIATALARRGHEVTVLTADRGKTDGEIQLSNIAGWTRSRGEWGWESRDNGVEAVYLPTAQSYRATTVNPRILRFCARRIRDYDIVHIYGLYDLIGLTAGWFCRRYGMPYVLEPLGMFGPKVRSQQKKRFYRKVVGNTLFANAKFIIATSETERAELIKGGIAAEKIVIRRNGIDLAEFQTLPARGALRSRHDIDQKSPLILFLGRISFIKGLDLLVKAFAQLSQIHPEARLVIAGPDDVDGCAEAVRKTIAELRLDDRVILSGPLYANERLEAFVDADIFVLPSRYESFGNVAAEAMACGTPVLITDRCGIAFLIENNTGLVVPCEVDALRKGMQQLLEDKALLSELCARCAETSRHLSWDEPIAAMERLYTSLLRQKVQPQSKEEARTLNSQTEV